MYSRSWVFGHSYGCNGTEGEFGRFIWHISHFLTSCSTSTSMLAWPADHTPCQSRHPSSSWMGLVKLCQDPCAACKQYRNPGSPNYTVSLHRQFVTPYFVWTYIFCYFLWPAFSNPCSHLRQYWVVGAPPCNLCSCNWKFLQLFQNVKHCLRRVCIVW